MGCDCGKPKCDGHCGVSPAVLQINNPSECVLFHKVEVPASMGTSVENPPKIGAYRNVLLCYEADGEAYLYTSDGIPNKITGTTSNYEILTNKPKINDVELVGNKSLADIGVTGAINNALEPYTPTSGFAEVAFTGSYTDLTDKPDIPSALHVFYMGPAYVGNTVPIYHDHEKTDQVTLAQFIDAIASGPVQIYRAYDMRSFQIFYVDQMDAFIPDPPQYTGTLYISFGLRDQYGLGVERFSWYEDATAPTYDSHDPNQSDWNQSNPTVSSYILNKPNLATVATSGSYNDLLNTPTIPAAQVNSDWDAVSGVAQILNKPSLAAVATSGSYNDLSNKPTIPAAQVNSDWDSTSGVSQILNKPTLATVATSGSYNDLLNKPTIPAAQVQSNWTQTTTTAVDYIKNKPTLATVATSGSYNDLTDKPTIPTVNNATLTIQKNGTDVQTFTANQSTNATANIIVPTKTSDLTNDGATGTSVYVEESDIAPSELSDEGELITLNGTTDCSILDTQLLGNAEQTTYSGKNLLNTNALSRTLPYQTTSRGITFTLDEDGSITLSGKNDGTGNSTFQIYNGTTPLVLVGGNYTGDLNPSDGVYRAVNMMSYDGTLYRSFRQSSTHALAANNYTIYFQVNNGETTQFSNYKIYPMLENGSSKSPYEPYVGSVDGSLTPSPSPSYPQTIQTVTGEQTVKITGRNLFDNTTAPITESSGTSASPLSSGLRVSYTSGSTTTEARFVCILVGDVSQFVGKNIVAQASMTPSASNAPRMAIGLCKADGSDRQTKTTIDASGSGYYTITSADVADRPYLYLYLYANLVGGTVQAGDYIDYTDLQVEVIDSTAPTPYEPYQEQSYEVNLGKNLFSVAFDSGGSTPASDTNAFTLTKPSTRTKMFTFPTALAAGTYTISFNITSDTTSQSSTTGGVRFQLVGSGGVISGTGAAAIGTGAKSRTWTVSEPVHAIYFYINNSEADDVSVAMTNVMLELGLRATTYAPYFTPIELAKIPDTNYRDKILYDEDDGKWYIERNVGKATVNIASTTTFQDRVCGMWSVSGKVNQANVGALCTNATFIIRTGTYQAVEGNFYENTTNFVFIGSANDTLATLQTKYSGSTIYYVLATPTTTEITDDTLIDQLEALAGALGYDGVTNIMSTSPGLPAILSVSTYTGSAIPPATRARAGIVRIGDGIDVDDCGTISVNAQKAPTAFTMQYADNLGGWQAGDNYELVKETTGTPTDYIYRANKFYYGGADVSFLNEKTGVTFTPQELYAWLIDGNEAVLNHVPLGWAVDNGAEVLYADNYIDGIWLKRENIASQSGNMISFNGSAFVTALIPRTSSYEETVQDTLGIAISGYEDDGTMVYDLISIDGFSLYGSVQESSPIL